MTARAPAAFKQGDVTRAIKGALAGGMNVGQCEIDRQGKITIKAQAEMASPATDLDKWEAERNARSSKGN